MNSETMATLFARFTQERKYLKNVTPKTMSWYDCSWKAFAPFIGGLTTENEDALRQGVREAIMTLAKRPTLKATSVNDYSRAIRAFLTWLHQEERISRPIRIGALKEHQAVRETLAVECVQRLIAFRPRCQSQRRVHTMALIVMDTGLRLGEVRSLRINDIDFDNLVLKVYSGKGRKQRLVPFTETLRKSLYKFVSSHAQVSDGHLFATSTGSLLTPRNALRDLKKVATKAGIPRIGWHMLRHTMATAYLRTGGNVAHLRRILGHSSLNTTLRYEHLQIEDLAAPHHQHSLLTNRRTNP